MTQTTASAAIGATDSVVNVTSATGITSSGPLNQYNTLIFVDRELMAVSSASGTQVTVLRGYQGTPQAAHASGALVWAGPPNYFGYGNPSGACTAANEVVLPKVAANTGMVWTCPTTGTNSGVWVAQNTSVPYQFTDGAFFIPATACNSSVSANSTGTNGFTTSGGSVLPVVQAQTSNSGTNTHTYICAINVPTRLTSGKGIQITDATFFYGVQTTGLGTQVATLASGTMNSSIVFSYVALPTAGASETPSTVTPVRADSGSLVITPAVASANVATTTAGSYYSMKFTPASPIALNTDLRTLFLTVTLLNTATSATVTNSPGVLVHYTESPL